MVTETAEIKNNKIPPQIVFPSFPKLCVEGWNVTYQVLWGEVCFSVWIMKVRNLSHPRRSSHGKSWRCGYGPRRLCHGGGQGWRYQGSKGRAVWMMLDNDLKSRWLRFGLQQVMLCDIYIYIYDYLYMSQTFTNQISNGVGLYHVCQRYLNDGSMINHVVILVESM